MTVQTQEISLSEFDAIIIGAGINGAGIARDAAMRGLKILLLDKGDIASGTSSWSTRLIHGGLRYLEHWEFGLVGESLRERETLFRIAPHLIRPLEILIPIYKQARRGAWTIRAGLIAYDLLSTHKRLPHHRMLSRAEALEQAPGLSAHGLAGAAVYYDAQVEFAERLVLENVLSALEHGATVITYARVNKCIVEDGQARGVEFTNELEGNTCSAWGTVVINASGPWVDQMLAETGAVSPRLIGGTKGSHIVVASFVGAPTSAIYVEAERDHRPFFIIPWNGNYLIGTTDIRYEGDLDLVKIEDDEIKYLLSETNRVIPGANLGRAQILYSYSGVRPLAYTVLKDEQSITRRHFIREHPHLENLLSIVGGKLTTYRSLAEQAVDLVFKKLGRTSLSCTTDQVPLPGAAAADFNTFSKEFKESSGLSEGTTDRLLRIYGTRSSVVLETIKENSSLAEVFDTETGAISAEVVCAFKNEKAQTLSDALFRRTMVGLNSACGLNAIEPAVSIVQKHLGWSGDRVAQEISAYSNYIERFKLEEGAKGAE